jgi:hypothetical protein
MRPHRGDGMKGRSPRAVYEELLSSPGAIQRQISPAQRRLAALEPKNVTLSPSDKSFSIYGARYWSAEAADLPAGSYTARFNPNDLAEPVYLYHSDGKLATREGVPQIARIQGNNDKATAKAIGKGRAAFRKANEARADAAQGVFARDAIKLQAVQKHPALAEIDIQAVLAGAEDGGQETLPVAKVVELVRPGVETPEAPRGRVIGPVHTPGDVYKAGDILKDLVLTEKQAQLLTMKREKEWREDKEMFAAAEAARRRCAP